MRPYHRNFGKRLIKSPKLYFLDTGLLCHLLQIRTPRELFHRAERGAVFESFVVSEFHKNYLHRGERPRLHFWRDSAGHDIDVIDDRGAECVAVEAKSAQTVAADFFEDLVFWARLPGNEGARRALFYSGDAAFRRSGVAVYPWHVL